MLHIIYSNQVEELVRVLIDKVQQHQAGSLTAFMDDITVVVPNWNLEIYLKLRVAEYTGIAANFKFLKIDEYLERLLPSVAHENYAVLTPQMLQTLLNDILADDILIGLPEMVPVKRYIEAKGTKSDIIAVRRFQLASQLQKCFREYELSRQDMLLHWPKGLTIEHRSFEGVEIWQRVIWLHIFGPDGVLDNHAKASNIRYKTLWQLLSQYDVRELVLPRTAHIFGLSYLPPTFGQFFHHLQHHPDHQLYLYALNPCAEYWEDIRYGDDEESTILVGSDSEFTQLFEHQKDTPALKYWSRAGRDNFRMLNNVAGADPEQYFITPIKDRPATVLRCIQEDILYRRPERPEVEADAENFSDDDSVTFLACPTVQREVEVIANEIWARMLTENAQGRRLLFSDIAVIVPSKQREIYQAQIQSIFHSHHQIPYNLADILSQSQSRLLKAVELLFALPLGQFKRRELLKFVVHPNVSSGFPNIEPEQWLAWCDELNILYGADRHDHEGTYIENDIFHWDQGLKRLVLGGFMGETDDAMRPIYRNSDGASYIPMTTSPGEMQSISIIVMLIRSLIKDAHFMRDARMTRKEWAAFMQEMIDSYLSVNTDQDPHELMQCYKILGALGASDILGREVGYQEVYQEFCQRLEQLETRRGQYLADGVAVSSFLPMRPIPFKVIFIAGMGEGQFPVSEGYNPLDLRLAKRQQGDIRPRDQDKYMFLETLISARDKLYLSWVAKDSSTGDALESSSVLKELLSVLQGYLSPAQLEKRMISHPLRRYHECYHFVTDMMPADKSESHRPEGEISPDKDLKTMRYVNFLDEARRESGVLQLRHQLQEYCERHAPDFSAVFPDRETFGSFLLSDVSEEMRQPFINFLKLNYPQQRIDRRDDFYDRDKLVINIKQLKRFLECPLQAAAQIVLGLYTSDDDDVIEKDHEQFHTEKRYATGLLREVFETVLERHALGEDRDAIIEAIYQHHIEAYELSGQSPTGLFQQIEKQAHIEIVRQWFDNFSIFQIDIEGAHLQRYHFGRALEYVDTSKVFAPLKTSLDVPGIDGNAPRRVDVHLEGDTQLLSADKSTSIILKNRADTKAKLKDFLPGVLDYVMLVASGQIAEYSLFKVVVNPCSSSPNIKGCVRELLPLSKEDARDYLTGLIGDIFSTVHDYLLPVEAVEEFVKKQGESPQSPVQYQEIIDKMLLANKTYWSSNYGPIRNPERFQAPSNAEELIARRFKPVLMTEEGAI